MNSLQATVKYMRHSDGSSITCSEQCAEFSKFVPLSQLDPGVHLEFGSARCMIDQSIASFLVLPAHAEESVRGAAGIQACCWREVLQWR